MELTVKQLSKPELRSVKTTILHQYIIHEAKTSVSEKIRDPKKLWNLKQNLNKTKRESSSSSENVARIVAAMKLEHGKSFIRNVTILPQY